ncbi:uncharacterized protein LOC129226837 [Uloborus diversus]|uniref:uncharacterized protein LOC129226837 n=1 Tax=Uloborus diversus TaxID=327109 RepID=UPI002409538C|nr:uncharacterized protein LOC129226837 [Uloborus diversus]
MDATKFANLSVPEKEKIFEGLKPFLKTSARFGVPLVNSLDEYESLSIAEQEVFFETITKPNLALLFTVPTEENSKLKQKTLDSWVISKNSPKKKSLEKESKCNESIFENRNENKSRENYATNSKDVTNTKSIENTGKQHSNISFSEVNSETGKKFSTSEKCDAVKKSQQVDSLIASISLDKINKTGNESESESNKKSKISNLPAIKGKSVKSNKQLSKCNKVEATQMKDDGIDKNPVEVNVIIENELYEASDSPKQLGKRRCKRKAETVVEDTPPQKIQKSVKSPVTESTGEVENTKHFIRKTRNRSKNRSDESLEKNINTDELVSVPSKSDFSSLPYMKETECLTKSTHTKNLKTIQQLKRATRIRGNQTNKSLLKQGTFSMECELSNTQTESHNAQKREKTPKESVTSLIDNESTGTKSFLNTYADKTKDSENFKTINKNDTTANSVITTKNKSEMKPKTSKMTKTPLKEGNFSPTCTLTTGANTKVEATVEDPIIIRIKKTSETQMSSEYASNVCSNKAKDPKTVASGDSIIVTNYNSKIKSKNDKVSRTLLKGSKISPHCEMSTRSTESCNSQERKIVIENQVELCADDVNFQPDTPSSSCLGANIISEENAISSNKTTELSKRSVRLANIKKTTKIPLKQDKFSPKCELTTVADNKVEVTAKDPIKIHIEETGKTLMSPKRASNVAFNKSKDTENELSVDSDSVTNNCPKIKSEKDKKARLKGCKFPLKSELSRSLTESCNSGESKIMNLTENHAELHIDDANIQPDIPSSSMSANMISEENTISSNKNKNTKSPIKSSRLANKASKLKSKCTSDSSVEDINMCVMKKTKITLDSNETESASQFLKPSKNLSLKNSSKFGIPHENIVSEERNSITARFSPNIPKLHETSEKDMLSACSEKTKNSGTLESCNRIVELESVNKMTFSPVKQSTNLENSIQLAEKPLSKHQINSKQKVTLDDSTESEKQILPSPKQSKISPKSNLSQQYKELNDEIDMYMTMAKNSSICKSQGGSSGLKTTETNESTLLQCTMDKHFQSPKKKSEKHSDKSEITKDNRLIGKAGKRNRKQVHKCASLVNASDTDNVIGSIDETETVPLSESTTNIERKDVKNVGSSPVSIQLQQAEVTRITNIHHKNVEDKIDLGLLKKRGNIMVADTMSKPLPNKRKKLDKNKILKTKRSQLKEKLIDTASEEKEKTSNDMGSSTVHDNIQPVLSPTMQKKYKEYNKLRESCAAIGIDVDELFECQEIKDMINNPDIFTKDGIIFIGPYKLPATEKVVPIVYAHSSKTDLCKSLEKMNIMNMKNTLSS